MSRHCECPSCGEDISDTWQDANPAIGCTAATWFCNDCEKEIEDDDDGNERL